MIIRSSINCPTVKVFHHCYFYLREATSESYGPRGLISIILLSILLSFAFVPNVSDLNLNSLCIKNPSTFHLSPYWQGLDNPLITLGAEICFLVCRGWTRGGARTSFWFDTKVLNWGKYFTACCIILSASRNHNTHQDRFPCLFLAPLLRKIQDASAHHCPRSASVRWLGKTIHHNPPP
jgi:hypothetical protein